MKKLSLMLVAMALGLTACPGTSTPAALTSVSGTVVEVDTNNPDPIVLKTTAWIGGAGSVSGSIGNTVVATGGTVDSAGAFSLTLPATVSDSLLVAADFQSGVIGDNQQCKGAPTISDPALKTAVLTVQVNANKKGIINSRTQTSSTNAGVTTIESQYGGIIYADRAAKVSGSYQCTSSFGATTFTTTVNINLTLVKGWNKANIKSSSTNGNGTGSHSSGDLPTNNWVYSSVTLP